MTSMTPILIAPHRPALGSTTCSPHLVTCCVDSPSCCLHLPIPVVRAVLSSAVTGMSAKTTEHLHCPQRVPSPWDQPLGSRKMNVLIGPSQTGKETEAQR